MRKVLAMAGILAVFCGLAVAQDQPMGGPEGQGGPGGKMRIEKREIRMMGGQREPGMGMGMGGQWWENPDLVKALGLTDKQVSDIDGLSLKHRKDMIRLQADLKIMQIDLRDLIENNAGDGDIKSKSKEIFQLRSKMNDAMVDHLLAMRKILTDEQRKKFKELKSARRENKGMMMDCPGCDRDGQDVHR